MLTSLHYTRSEVVQLYEVDPVWNGAENDPLCQTEAAVKCSKITLNMEAIANKDVSSMRLPDGEVLKRTAFNSRCECFTSCLKAKIPSENLPTAGFEGVVGTIFESDNTDALAEFSFEEESLGSVSGTIRDASGKVGTLSCIYQP